MNLKLIFWGLTILALLLVFKCSPRGATDCKQFKNGDFEYRSNGLYYEITRTDTVQTEINKLNGDITKNSIRWTDDCAYELRLLESTAIYPDSINQLRMASTLTVTIMSWTDDYYIYRSKSNMVDRVMVDTLWLKNR